MFMGISGTEMIILVVVALVVIGPKRLPEYAEKLRDLVRHVRRMAEGAKESVQRDFGDDFKDVDWQKLDPRQYDPRRIVREALVEEDSAIREAKRRDQVTGTSAGAGTAAGADSTAKSESTGNADVTAGSTAADRADANPALSPIERFQAQHVRRDRTAPAPFDPEAT